MIIVKCDRCGAEIEKEAQNYRVEIVANRDAGSDGYVEEVINDLCDHCRKELHRFLSLADYYWDTHDPSGGDLPPEDEEETAGDTEEKKDGMTWYKGKRKERAVHVDHGQICALRKAGWSVKEICAEMHLAPATVHNHLKAEKEKTKI